MSFLEKFAKEKKAQLPTPYQSTEEVKELLHKAIREITFGLSNPNDWNESEIREVANMLPEIGGLVDSLNTAYKKIERLWKVR